MTSDKKRVDTERDRRQLQIKSGVVKRLAKEHQLYKQEAVKHQQKLDEFKANGEEGQWEVKNATRIMEEGEKMIKISGEQLEKARGELFDLVTIWQNKSELQSCEELSQAVELLSETNTSGVVNSG